MVLDSDEPMPKILLEGDYYAESIKNGKKMFKGPAEMIIEPQFRGEAITLG